LRLSLLTTGLLFREAYTEAQELTKRMFQFHALSPPYQLLPLLWDITRGYGVIDMVVKVHEKPQLILGLFHALNLY
jgi:hypothetical protein